MTFYWSMNILIIIRMSVFISDPKGKPPESTVKKKISAQNKHMYN